MRDMLHTTFSCFSFSLFCEMNSDTTTCYLYNENEALPSIFLPDKKEIFIGRSPETTITDTHCSRRQVHLHANYAVRKVYIKRVGSHASGLNGIKLERDIEVVAQHDDCLELLYGKYPFKIEFNPVSESNKVLKPRKRRRVVNSECDRDDEDKRVKKFEFDSNEDTLHINMLDSISNSLREIKSDLEENTKNLEISTMKNSEMVPDLRKNSKLRDEDTWRAFDGGSCLVFTSKGAEDRSQIAAYDMDKTLIKTKSGFEFPKDANDWELWHPEVPGKLKKIYADGYKIVIFTNQGSFGKGKVTADEFKLKIERIVKRVGVPIQVFIAAAYDKYRKPCTGMWDLLMIEGNNGVLIDKEKSFYVGDAAGRPARKELKRKKDHSLVDRLFAMNLGLAFFTPEEHFLGHKNETYNPPAFHPKQELQKNIHIYDPPDTKINLKTQEIIVMVGSPGSGKTHFAKAYLTNYHYVSRDSLGSWQKCISETEKAVSQGKNVVVDNTNPDEISRQRYIELGKKHQVPVRCFVMAVDKLHTKHNNKFRSLTDSNHQKISDLVINSYAKNFRVPSKEEGFAEIVKVNFVPKFKTDGHRKLYEMYLLEN